MNKFVIRERQIKDIEIPQITIRRQGGTVVFLADYYGTDNEGNRSPLFPTNGVVQASALVQADPSQPEAIVLPENIRQALASIQNHLYNLAIQKFKDDTGAEDNNA